jgi:hypothetical protein
MRTHLFRWLFAAAVTSTTIASAQPSERDHRHDRDEGPREAPPPARVERFEARAGFVWQPGRWQWNRGRYDWVNGHYERERAGKKWREGRWDRRGDAYVWVDGDWIDFDVRPRVAPPAPREEAFEARPGWVYLKGRWDWRNGEWQWQPGRWEKHHKGKHWREGRWELRDGAYVLVEGDWEDIPAYPVAAPPELREERHDPRAGFVWVRGRWDWKDGEWQWMNGHWERERANMRWNEGRWELKDGRYVWVEGGWGAPPPPVVVAPPVQEWVQPDPPAPREENPGTRSGFVWVRGHYGWNASAKEYTWLNGHWERERANRHWIEGHWDHRGREWFWVEGGWQ